MRQLAVRQLAVRQFIFINFLSFLRIKYAVNTMAVIISKTVYIAKMIRIKNSAIRKTMNIVKPIKTSNFTKTPTQFSVNLKYLTPF